jgi:hypothetical protein
MSLLKTTQQVWNITVPSNQTYLIQDGWDVAVWSEQYPEAFIIYEYKKYYYYEEVALINDIHSILKNISSLFDDVLLIPAEATNTYMVFHTK